MPRAFGHENGRRHSIRIVPPQHKACARKECQNGSRMLIVSIHIAWIPGVLSAVCMGRQGVVDWHEVKLCDDLANEPSRFSPGRMGSAD